MNRVISTYTFCQRLQGQGEKQKSQAEEQRRSTLSGALYRLKERASISDELGAWVLIQDLNPQGNLLPKLN